MMGIVMLDITGFVVEMRDGYLPTFMLLALENFSALC